jgi:hypothetical protein
MMSRTDQVLMTPGRSRASSARPAYEPVNAAQASSMRFNNRNRIVIS